MDVDRKSHSYLLGVAEARIATYRDALTDAAQFIDTVRQDAITEGWWTEWDQHMRDKIGAALQAMYENELRDSAPYNPPSR